MSFYGITIHSGDRKNGFRIGVEYSMVEHAGEPYLARWILYCGLTLRLHKFYQGDDDRAPHDHPWWFVTFPLATYREWVWNPQDGDFQPHVNTVRRFRFHFRPATYRHRVLPVERPFWTIVVSGKFSRVWGFWPKPNEFVPYWEWK